MRLLSILLAKWQNSQEEVDEEAYNLQKGVDEKAGRYDDCLLLSLGWINPEVNKWG